MDNTISGSFGTDHSVYIDNRPVNHAVEKRIWKNEAEAFRDSGIQCSHDSLPGRTDSFPYPAMLYNRTDDRNMHPS